MVTFRVDRGFSITATQESCNVIENRGVGLVVDAERGWVLSDRRTVPQPLGDIEVPPAFGLNRKGVAWSDIN